MLKCFLIFSYITVSLLGSLASASDLSKEEMNLYLQGCIRGLSQAKTNFDAKDIEMLCSDPYLQGKPNESASDKARRMKLINRTNEDKIRMMSNLTKSKDDIKPCFDSILANDPGADLKDVKMLCMNPYLTPTPDESEDDRSRRTRLIRESEAAKEKMLDAFVTPIKGKSEKAPAAVR